MNTLTFIVGLPGSGKSYLGIKMQLEQLRADDPSTGMFLDDIGKLENPLGHLLQSLRDDTKEIIVTDYWLCKKANRERIINLLEEEFQFGMAKRREVKWIFFENAPDKCRENVKYRTYEGDARVVEPTIWIYSKQYDIPEGADVREIWQPSDNIQTPG